MERGDLDQVSDLRYTAPDGSEKLISADERKDRAKAAYLKQSRERASDTREEPQEALAREFHAFRLSGEKHPVIERAVGGIADMANAGVLDTDTPGREKLLGKLLAYEWLQNESTSSLLAYTEENDRDFAESYLMARRYLQHDDGRGYSDEDALSFAIRSTELTRSGMPLASSSRDEINAQVRKLSTERGWIWEGDAEPMNASIAQQRVTNLAQRFVQLGVKPERAVKMAGEAVKNTSLAYRGVLLDLQGRPIPADFREVMDTLIDDFAGKFPHVLKRNGVEAKDITISPLSSGGPSGGRFVLVDRETLLPLVDEAQNHAVVNLSDIRTKSKQAAEKRARAALRSGAFNSSLYRYGYVQAQDTDGSVNWIDPDTREVMDFTFGDDDTAPAWRKTGRRYRRSVITTPDGGVNIKARDGDLGIGAASRFVYDGMVRTGQRYRRAAQYLWSILPEVKIGDEAFQDE